VITTKTPRERLRSKVVHAAEILHEQGPISTFIHTNPLDGFEHLPFERGVAEAERLLGGRGYLPNKEFRRLYLSGRITEQDLREALASSKPDDEEEAIAVAAERVLLAQDVRLVHLLYGIEALDPMHLSWQVQRAHATKRFREDVPEGARTLLLAKAKTELRLSLERIGRDWTLCDWVQMQLHGDLADRSRDRLFHDMHERPETAADSKDVDRWFAALEIPLDRREEYLRCIDRHIGHVSVAQRAACHVRWLQVEHEWLDRLLPHHLGVPGTFAGLASGCEHKLEVYAVTRLWHTALAARGLDDPLRSPNPDTVTAEDPLVSLRDALHRRIVAVEEDRGLSLPLIEALRTAIEEEVRLFTRRRTQRGAILLGLCRIAGPVDPNQLPPLTFTEETQSRLRVRLPRGIGYPTGLMRLADDVYLRKGFDWEAWDDVLARPLFVGTAPVDDGAWRAFLRDGLRVRVTEDVRQALHEKFFASRLDPQAEDRRRLILGGLKEDGLTLIGWEALQDDIEHWDDGDLLGGLDPLVEAQLSRIVLEGLRKTELTRPAYDALRQLIEGRGRSVICQQLLTNLHRVDPSQQLLTHAHDDVTAAMRALGRDLTFIDLLRELTDFDITERVNRYMIKWCGAFLDEGIAGLPMPGREQGFYLAWKTLAAGELALVFGNIDGWKAAVQSLPDRADDSLVQTLDSLQIDDEFQADYLRRRLLQLPGWAALIKWREHHPLHPHQQRHHIDLVEFLAVRLFCESLLIKQVCRRLWGVDGTVHCLQRLYHDHPYEFFVRREFSRGGLSDFLNTRIRELLFVNPQRNRDAWVQMAEMIWVYREATAPGRDPVHTVCRNAWRLFHLAQFLGMSPAEIQALSVSDTDRLMATLDAFPSAAHGPVWQRAYEGHYQGELLKHLEKNMYNLGLDQDSRFRAQLVFCIDEREESIRRHVETLDPAYETFGTAGFFGVAMNYTGLSDHGSTPLCPAVVTPSHQVREIPTQDHVKLRDRSAHRAKWLVLLEQLFVLLKGNVLTSYLVIDVTAALMALILLGKTLLPRPFAHVVDRLYQWFVPPIKTTLALDAPDAFHPTTQPLGFAVEEQIRIVEGQLRVIGLTKGFARLIVFVGHGSTSQNNPHESAYDCGACGGKHGGSNARALASMANKPEVRFALRERGIDIPGDTYFIGSIHNTASDGMTYFETERIPAFHRQEYTRLVRDLDEARARNAKERCRLLPLAPKDASPSRALRHMERRSVDFTQVHPEWGHATNASAVIGRRGLTKGLLLDRRAFLHSYDPYDDPEGTILEGIMTAVGPVIAGIGLEYYFSRVDNERYGSGSKILHNVSGLVGVMAGKESDLRTGLPFQMVWVHEPMRVTFVIEGLPTIVRHIVQKHRPLQKLFDNRWLHLIVLDIRTGQFVRYESQGQWEPMSMHQPAIAT
jgi:uncharacterized protein YbcC (UPF0753/DUF2309 family)